MEVMEVRGGGGALIPHFARYVPPQSNKNVGSGTSSRVKMGGGGVFGTSIGNSGTYFIGIRGVFGTRYCENL